MRLSVHHVTNFAFDQPSGHSIHDVRLTPKPAAGQRIVSWDIHGPGRPSQWIDGHGNQVATFTVPRQHEAVEIVVEGVYEFSDAEGWLRYFEVPTLPAPFWLRNSGLARHDAKRKKLRGPQRGKGFMQMAFDDHVERTIEQEIAQAVNQIVRELVQ